MGWGGGVGRGGGVDPARIIRAPHRLMVTISIWGSVLIYFICFYCFKRSMKNYIYS